MFKSKASKASKLLKQLQHKQPEQPEPPKQDYLIDCHRTYSCIHCRAHLANHDELISKLFQGNHGRAYLFNKVLNVGCKQAVERELLTGLHAVADIYCDCCETTLGWKYEQAFVPSQKYKEGKYIIELVHMLKENSWDLSSYNSAQLLVEAERPAGGSGSELTNIGGSRRAAISAVRRPLPASSSFGPLNLGPRPDSHQHLTTTTSAEAHNSSGRHVSDSTPARQLASSGLGSGKVRTTSRESIENESGRPRDESGQSSRAPISVQQ